MAKRSGCNRLNLILTTTRMWIATRLPALAAGIACVWIQESSGSELMGLAGMAVLFGAYVVLPAVAAWMLIDFILFVARRVAYSKDGEGARICLYCGYQLDGYAQMEEVARVVCPECGHHVVVARKDNVV